MADISGSSLARDAWQLGLPVRSDIKVLRSVAVVAGLAWSVLFVVVGLRYDLQMFGDGSIFSYAVAVQDGWQFHWHNIASRLFVHLFSHVPAETYVGLTGDARGGIFVYGLLFFGAPLLGLLLTFVADASRGGIIFGYACASTACLCPLVFGAPTEMWAAHALFWPALAHSHYARGPRARLEIFALLLALLLTHEGALIFATTILATLLLRGVRDPALRRAVGAFGFALVIWLAVKLALRPDDYFGSVLFAAALNFIDVSSLATGQFPLLLSAVTGYLVAFLAFNRVAPARAHIHAGLVVVAALAAYWLIWGGAEHGDSRYYLRTALLIFTPAFGVLAAAFALEADQRLTLPVPMLAHTLAALANGVAVRAAAGAILVATLVHAVETARFVEAWRTYEAAVRGLAVGTASDPKLGDPRFVSTDRIAANLNTVAWSSTTPFLSVVVAPGFRPARLVVDPRGDYFWLSCRTASENRDARRAIPVASRELVRVHACLHRK